METSIETARTKFEEHVRRGIFAPVARSIRHEDPEDRLQDAIAQTWEMVRRHALRGEEVSPAILVLACRRRARDLSRHFAHDGIKKHDVYDTRNYLEGRVEWVDVDAPDIAESVGSALVNDSNPSQKVDSAIDLRDWLATLPARDQKMLRLRGAGHTWAETSRATRTALRTAYERCLRLGNELQSRACASQ